MTTLNTAIGVFFGLFAEFFGSSANIQIKYSHKLEDKKSMSEQIPLFKRVRFRIAIILYIFNGIFNLISCIFASLNVLAPTSSFTIVLNAILAHIYFKEKLTKTGYFASFLIMVGSTIAVIYGRNESKTSFNLSELTALVTKSGSMFFAITHWFLITFCILVGKAMSRSFIQETSVIFDNIDNNNNNNNDSSHYTAYNQQQQTNIFEKISSFTSKFFKNSDTQYAVRALCYSFGVGSIASWVQFFGKAVGVLISESVGGDPQFYKFGSWLYMIFALWFIYWMMILISDMMKNFEAVLIVPLYETFIIFNMIVLDAIYFGSASEVVQASSNKMWFWMGILICIIGMFVLTKTQKLNHNLDDNDDDMGSMYVNDDEDPMVLKSDDDIDDETSYLIKNMNNNNDDYLFEDIMDNEDCPLIASKQNRKYSDYNSTI